MHKDWIVGGWESVDFSDKQGSIISTLMARVGFGSMIKKPSNSRLKKIIEYGGSLILWSCLTIRGVGSLCRIEKTLNALSYLVAWKIASSLIASTLDFMKLFF